MTPDTEPLKYIQVQTVVQVGGKQQQQQQLE